MIAVDWDHEPRETSGMTGRLVLEYVDRVGGRPAVDAVLRDLGLEDDEHRLRDEHAWFSFALKIALFDAAARVLDDPYVARHAGEVAIGLQVGEPVKIALRALGTPKLVYDNVVRAQGKFTTTHVMRSQGISGLRARIAAVDISGTGYAFHDCQYNIGLLACVPTLFGQPLASVTHTQCAGTGADACIYEISWPEAGGEMRNLVASSVLGAGTAAAIALAVDPVALAAAVPAALALTSHHARRLVAVRRRRWAALERENEDLRLNTERLSASLHDLVSELHSDDLLDKVIRHAGATVNGSAFVLLLRQEDGLRVHSSSAGVPTASLERIEAWATVSGVARREALLIDDARSDGSLSALADHPSVPFSALCSAPVLFRGEELGVLIALGARPHSFLARDHQLLATYASHVAIALTNARLYAMQESLAREDPLTGLGNHRAFHESLHLELERCARGQGALTLVLLDLDGFKAINDTAGHAEGDRVLRRVADAIRSRARRADQHFRVGGDEFAVLLSADDDQTAAERIAAAIAEADPRIAASYGLARWGDDGATEQDLTDRADARLYEMKRHRKDAAFAG